MMDPKVPTQEPRCDRKRIETKSERGVCRIRRSCSGNPGSDQRYETVGSGVVIWEEIAELRKRMYYLVTAFEIFRGDSNIKNYRVDFVKSKSKLKTFFLKDAVVDENVLQNSPGLAVIRIPLDSSSSVFRHGCLFRRKCGTLRHYSFEVDSIANTRGSEFLNGLSCHMVVDDSKPDSFGVKMHGLDQNSGQYYLTNWNPLQGTPLGAALIRRDGDNWSVAGVLSSFSTDGFCCPTWLKEDANVIHNVQASLSETARIDVDSGNRAEEKHIINNTATDHGVQFDAFLDKIADEITEEELKEMKFLCNDQTSNNNLPRGKLDAIKSQREFLSFLCHRDKICSDDVSYLVGLLTKVGCIRLATSIEEQAKVQPQNLPCLTLHFVGRDAEVKQIITKLQTSRMVVILSIPGMGKTELGVRVSHLLKEKGDQFVTHIRVESHHRGLENVCSEILGRISSRTWSRTADFVSLAKRKLSERMVPTVLVLDNTESIQDKAFDEFAEWLVTSAPNVKLMITTRKDVEFRSANVCTFRLKPLDPHSSAELLRRLVGDCSEVHSNKLAELCGGIPLLLVTYSDFLNNGFSPKRLIQYLGNNPIQLIKSGANDVYNRLKVFFTNFPDEIKKNLALLSVFPSEFSAEDIQFIFEDPLHSDLVKTRMVKYALLQRDADEKVRMHPLVQAYFRTEKGSLGMGELWHATQRKFNHHYLDLLRDLSREFISKDSALVAIHKFRQQKANIMEALNNCLEDSNDSDDKKFILDVVNSTEVLDFVAKVLTPPKECTMLFQKCCDIAKASGDKKRHAESLNSLGFRRLCDVSHSKDSPEVIRVTLAKFQEAYDTCIALPEEELKSQTHAHTASKLGVCFVLQGDEKEGRKLIQEGISIRESLSNRLYVAAGYCDLGNSYRLCDDHQKAIDIWKENTLPVYREQLGNHPWTATILSYIADSSKALADGQGYTDQAKKCFINQANKYFKEALKLRKELLGDHQDTARSHVQLSDVLVHQGKFDEALEELNKAFVLQNDILGPDHKITMNTVSKRNNVRDKLGSDPS